MTVQQLRMILSALPTDCDDLPVLIWSGAIHAPLNWVEIDPPRNYWDLLPCVRVAYSPEMERQGTDHVACSPRHG